ncbi:lipopolysaccharide biosynthesis protein [Paludisphaera rhizosphaerae]|nr:oligosaccharide flippase family protein [Paludisphaera rhizosphaerae]
MLLASSLGLLGRVGGSAATLVSTVLLSRMLTTAEFGEYVLVLTVVLIGSILGALSMGEAILRFVGVRLGMADSDEAWSACRKGLLIATIGLVAVGVGYMAGYETIRRLIPGLPLGRTNAAWAALWMISSGIGLVLSCALRAFDRIMLGTLVEITLYRVGLVVILAAMWAVGATSLTSAIAASALVASIVTLGAAVALVRMAPPRGRIAHIGPNSWELVHFALPLLGSGLLFRFMSDASLWMISVYCSADEIALYGAAYRLWVVFSIPQVAVNAAIQGPIARLQAQGDGQMLERLMRGATMTALWPTFGITVVVLGAGSSILGFLYGPYYAEGGTVLVILCIAQLMCTAVGSSEQLAAMSGRQFAVLMASVPATIVSLVLSVALIPRFGLSGGAVAAGCSSLLFKMILAAYCASRLGVRTWLPLGRDTIDSFTSAPLALVQPDLPQSCSDEVP